MGWSEQLRGIPRSNMQSERTRESAFTNPVNDAKIGVRVRHIACLLPLHYIEINY